MINYTHACACTHVICKMNACPQLLIAKYPLLHAKGFTLYLYYSSSYYKLLRTRSRSSIYTNLKLRFRCLKKGKLITMQEQRVSTLYTQLFRLVIEHICSWNKLSVADKRKFHKVLVCTYSDGGHCEIKYRIPIYN